MSVTSSTAAITVTASAKAAAQLKGRNLDMLMTHAKTQAGDLRQTITQIIADHPGGDPNLSALNTLLASI